VLIWASLFGQIAIGAGTEMQRWNRTGKDFQQLELKQVSSTTTTPVSMLEVRPKMIERPFWMRCALINDATTMHDD
jgi:hypothetical protein